MYRQKLFPQVMQQRNKVASSFERNKTHLLVNIMALCLQQHHKPSLQFHLEQLFLRVPRHRKKKVLLCYRHYLYFHSAQ